MTIQNFDVRGLACAAGYGGKPVATPCTAHNTAYSVDGCTPCGAGKYQHLNTADTATCQTCSKGKSFANKTVACASCSAGQYQDQTGVISVQCKACTPGKYSVAGESQITESVCQACVPGDTRLRASHKPHCAGPARPAATRMRASHKRPRASANLSRHIPKLASLHRMQSLRARQLERASQTPSVCKPCQAGTYQNSQPPHRMQSRAPGRFSERASPKPPRACQVCADGTYTLASGSPRSLPSRFCVHLDRHACVGCAPGKHQSRNDAAKASCKVCEGANLPISNSSVCKDRPAGRNRRPGHRRVVPR